MTDVTELVGREGCRPRPPTWCSARLLEAICAAIADTGFVIERLIEPRPAPGAAALAPAKHERLSTGPYGFIAFRLRPAP